MSQNKPYSRIFLVMDEDFNERGPLYADKGPLWLVESPQNIALVEEIRRSGTTHFANAPTCFAPLHHLTREQRVAQAIWSMDDHHPDWQEFEVIGHPLTEAILKAFEECAPGRAETTDEGFVFYRTGPRVQTASP